MDQAALARRGDDSRILYMGDAWGLGFHPTFPADILNSLRREAYEALLIRASPIALRAYPQSKTPFLLIDLSEIHGRPIVGTSDAGNHVQLIRISVLAQDEVSTIDVVVDETIGLRTGIYERLCRVTFGVQEALIKPHLHVMLVTKRAKFLARLGSRHRSSSRTPPNELPLETAHQWNTLVPLDFGVVSQCVRSYASGVQVSRAYSLKVQKLGGLEVVQSEHLCILSDGKDQVAKGKIGRLARQVSGSFRWSPSAIRLCNVEWGQRKNVSEKLLDSRTVLFIGQRRKLTKMSTGGQISACISALQKPSIKADCPEKECQSCRKS
jgi:hypothetical protein